MTQQARPREIKALAGVRALPPLILVLYHYCEGRGYRKLPWFDLPVGKGYLWVEFFFALSGFILIYVYANQEKLFHTLQGYRAFLRNRLIRLYPVHLFTLLSMLALMGLLNLFGEIYGYVSIYHEPYPPMNTWPSFFASLFLVQAWNLFPWLTWNTASWFVSALFLICLIFPLYLFWSRGGLMRALLLLAGGITTLAWLATTTHHGLDLTFKDGIFRGMADFAVGCSLAMLCRHATIAGAQKLPDWIFSLGQVASLACIFWAMYGIRHAHSRDDVWIAAALFTLIFALAFDRGFLARALACRPMLKLGEWSFGIYMGQIFWFQFFRYVSQRLYPPGETLFFGVSFGDILWRGEPLVMLAITIAWGAFLYRWVEMPAARWCRNKLQH